MWSWFWLLHQWDCVIFSFFPSVPDHDESGEVAATIKLELAPGEQVYIANYEQIVYYLLDHESPTKYVHPNLIFTDTRKALKINADLELKRIMDTSPEYIIVERENENLNRYIKKKFRLIGEMDQGNIRFFRLI